MSRLRKQVESLRDGLVRVNALTKTGKYRVGLEQVRRLEKISNHIDYPPVQAEVLYHLGWLLYKTGDYKTAETMLYEAARFAAKGKDNRLVARALSLLLFVVGSAQGRPKEGLSISRYVEIAVEQAGGDESLKSRLFHNMGAVFYRQNEVDKALAYYKKILGDRRKKTRSKESRPSHVLQQHR